MEKGCTWRKVKEIRFRDWIKKKRIWEDVKGPENRVGYRKASRENKYIGVILEVSVILY